MNHLGPLVLLLTLSAGCAMAANESEAKRKHLEPRAAFELQCDVANLRFTALNHWSNGVTNEWGVEGCGKRAVYVRDYGSGAWVQNSVAVPSTAAPEP